MKTKPNYLCTYFCLALIFTLLTSWENDNIYAAGNGWDTTINFGWRFAHGSHDDAIAPDYDDASWQQVDLPHDWAISGPFGEKTAAGNTGKLPWKGEGWYRKTFELSAADSAKRLQFLFDGVMANPQIFLNGKKVGSWRYGYNSFWIDATEAAKFGEQNVLVVHADTREHNSRWYPGAGMYRKMSMRLVSQLHIPVWGMYVTTPVVTQKIAIVRSEIQVTNTSTESRLVKLQASIYGPSGVVLAVKSSGLEVANGQTGIANMSFEIDNPELWDINHPALYHFVARVYEGEQLVDEQRSTFGVRTFEWTANDGFHLNGRRVQIHGVDLHHDQGPLGAAFFPRAMERQLQIMKNMGVNALRTSHNACAPEVLALCDKMGIIVFNELFDKYGPTAGIQCSTAEFVDKYAEDEVHNFVMRDRNHPCVVVWSIGNEIGDILTDKDGKSAEHVAKMVSYFKKYDITRPTTMGCHIASVSEGNKHILDALQTSGWNYARRYASTRKAYPNLPLIYSESASAFGTRGAYKLSLPTSKTDWGNDGEINAYMLTSAPWSDIPEHEFEYMRLDSYMAGEFVWTGFDYLGEPTPYLLGKRFVQTPEGYTARSSYFGIVDLAGFPKDSYYNYRSYWNTHDTTVHLTPHWNWKGHEGQKIPVFLYTSGDEAELFLNGKSLGRKHKLNPDSVKTSQEIARNPDFVVHPGDTAHPYYEIVDAYRLRWMNVPYAKGQLKAVAYKNGKKIGESVVKTAGKPRVLKLTPDRPVLRADGMDLCYITVEMLDKNGVLCPLAKDELQFQVNGAARLMGVANGDAMSHDSFTDSNHPLFYGKAVVVLRSIPGKSGPSVLHVSTLNGKRQSVVKVVFE